MFIERLIEQVKMLLVEMEGFQALVLLRNADYLTTRAFTIFYNYIRQSISNNVVFVMVSGNKS